MNFLEYSAQAPVYFAVTFVAAAINSVAGGGTFLTFPVFIFNGLTATQANIMSTIALWPGSLASIYGYKSEIAKDTSRFWPFLIIGALGGALGAFLLLRTPEVVFKQLVPYLLLGATLIFTFGKYLIGGLHRASVPPRLRILLALLLQIAIAVYGGYFGAGIGILTLAMLQILGHTDIHKMNALKTILASAVNSVTAIIFIFSGSVIWPLALIMIAGGVAGGYVGARVALKIQPHTVRTIVSVIGFSMTAYFFLYGA